MTYIRHIPSAPLNAFIDDIYMIDAPAPYTRLKVIPMPSLHLMVNFGDAFRVRESEQDERHITCSESWSVGLWSRYHVVDWPANVYLIGIHFKPGGAYPFLQLPLSELHNQVVPLEAIYGRQAAEMRERLYDAPTAQAKFALLERLLLARLCEAPHHLELVQHAVAQMARRHGALSIRALSEQIGISQNHLGTQFKRMVGVVPKDLARFYRFAHVLRSIDPAQPVDWMEMARRTHFYDQSHFSKEFIAFTGHNPTEYLRILSRSPVENTESERSLGQLAID